MSEDLQQNPMAQAALTATIEGSIQFSGVTVPVLCFRDERYVPVVLLAKALCVDGAHLLMDLTVPAHARRYGAMCLYATQAEGWLMCVKAHAVTQLIGNLEPDTMQLRDPYTTTH